MAGIAYARDPGVEVVEIAHGPVFAAIDRDFPRRLRARGGKRDRGALEAAGLVLPVAGCAAVPLARYAPSPACGGGLGGGCFRITGAGIIEKIFPTRRASRVDLPRKRER